MNPQFASLVLGLGQQATTALGGQRPEGLPEGQTAADLAKAVIDTLGMLEEKTRGNLTDEETKLMTQVLTALRFAFVQKGNA